MNKLVKKNIDIVLRPSLNPDARLISDSMQLISGEHFFDYDNPDLIARKSLVSAILLMAARGVRPVGFSLSLSVPERLRNNNWISKYKMGLSSFCEPLSLQLIDFQINSGAWLVVDVEVFGEAVAPIIGPGGARPGDMVCVSGVWGASFSGLQQRRNISDGFVFSADVDRAYMMPDSRMGLGLALTHIASSCALLTAGLIVAIMDIACASNVNLIIDDIPTNLGEDALMACEIELLFTVSPSKCHSLHMIPDPINIIGRVCA